MAAVPRAAAIAAARGMTFVPGIEITAVADGRDVHVLGYFLDPDSTELTELIAGQRHERFVRACDIVERLSEAGAPLDGDLLFAADGEFAGATIARPQIAQALVRAGHVSSISEAFDRFLDVGRPGYVPHKGPRPETVVASIVRAGGIASLAHPGPLGRDDSDSGAHRRWIGGN